MPHDTLAVPLILPLCPIIQRCNTGRTPFSFALTVRRWTSPLATEPPLIVMKSTLVGIIWNQGIGCVASQGRRALALVLSLVALPCLLSAQTLQHRYSFVSDASDSVGSANGTVVGPTTGTAVSITNGLLLPGGGGPGFSGYVVLPAGILNT